MGSHGVRLPRLKEQVLGVLVDVPIADDRLYCGSLLPRHHSISKTTAKSAHDPRDREEEDNREDPPRRSRHHLCRRGTVAERRGWSPVIPAPTVPVVLTHESVDAPKQRG